MVTLTFDPSPVEGGWWLLLRVGTRNTFESHILPAYIMKIVVTIVTIVPRFADYGQRLGRLLSS